MGDSDNTLPTLPYARRQSGRTARDRVFDVFLWLTVVFMLLFAVSMLIMLALGPWL